MDCVIPGPNIRLFTAAISSLSRVGKDLYLDFDPIQGLVLRTLNDAKSAYACFRYEPLFFEKCTTKRASQDSLAGRLPLRALAVVVPPRKQVERLRILADDTQISFQFTLSTGTTIVHRLQMAPAQSLSAKASKDGASELQGSPKLLRDFLQPLTRSPEGVLYLGPNRVAASDYTPATVTQPSLQTQLTLNVADLDEYEYVSSTTSGVVLVVPLKELRAVLHFAAQCDAYEDWKVGLFFHQGGQPLLVETKGAPHFSAELVLATLDPGQVEGVTPPQQQANESPRVAVN